MATGGRPQIQETCLDRLEDAGHLLLSSDCWSTSKRIYYAGSPGITRPGWEVVRIPHGKPVLFSFWRVLTDALPNLDLVFFEDDVWIVENGVARIDDIVVPPDVGALSLFDFRNDCPATKDGSIFRMPVGREFWGTQAVKIPAAVVVQLAELAYQGKAFLGNSKHDLMNSWDVWLGRAV
jgi:hypothetical protein